MNAHIVCGSPNLWLPKNLSGYLVGVDRGALKLIEKGFSPNLSIGDFDSVDVKEHQLIKEKSHLVRGMDSIKDVTDCEAAVEYLIKQGCRLMYIYGATGGRLDHQYAVTALMLNYAKQNVKLFVIDETNTMFVLLPGHHQLVAKKKYISFFSLAGSVSALKLKGFKYPLQRYDLQADDALCVSNEAASDTVDISFESGYLLTIESCD